MSRLLLGVALLTVATTMSDVMAASWSDIEFEVPVGSAFAEALAEAHGQAAACKEKNSSCRPEAPSPAELGAQNGACSGHFVVRAWRKAEDLSNANLRIDELRRLAGSRTSFGCTGSRCLAVARTRVRNEANAAVSTLSVCQVSVVSGVAGAPERCIEALKEHPQQGRLLLADVGNGFVACSLGMRDFDAVFKDHGTDIARVRKLVGEVLAASPFNLAIMEDRGSILGTRTQLASDIWKGWREWVTVRVDFDVADSDAGASISTTLLAGKQAAAERDAWAPASEGQESAYLLTLREALRKRGADISSGLRRR